MPPARPPRTRAKRSKGATMNATLEQPEVLKSMHAALTAPAATAVAIAVPHGPAIEDKPLVGGEINIKLALSPGMITLLAAPACVLVTMVVGWILLKTAGLPTCP